MVKKLAMMTAIALVALALAPLVKSFGSTKGIL